MNELLDLFCALEVAAYGLRVDVHNFFLDGVKQPNHWLAVLRGAEYEFYERTKSIKDDERDKNVLITCV